MCLSFADFGIETLEELAEKTSFPWLMSNVTDNETGRPLAEGKITHVIEFWGRKIGLVCSSAQYTAAGPKKWSPQVQFNKHFCRPRIRPRTWLKSCLKLP